MKKSGTQMNTLKKVLQYIETYRFWMLASIVLAAVTVALTLYIPILVGRAIDFIIDRGNVDFVSIKAFSGNCHSCGEHRSAAVDHEHHQ